MLKDLEDLIEKELSDVKAKKKKIEMDLGQHNLSMQMFSSRSTFHSLMDQSKQTFTDLKDCSSSIRTGINEISEISTQALKNFETLKFRKFNIEIIINTMTSVLEMKRILPLLDKAVQNSSIEESIKLFKIYRDLEKFIPKDFCSAEMQKIQELTLKLKELSKKEFEASIKTNNTKKMTEATELGKILGLEDNTIEKMIAVYDKKLSEDLKKIEESINGLALSYKFANLEEYDLDFFKIYLKVLEILAGLIEEFKTNIFKNYGVDGLVTIIQKLVNDVADKNVKATFDKLIQFYELGNVSERNFNSGMSQKDVTVLLQRIDLFCEEISRISNQNELFNKYLISVFKDVGGTLPQKDENKVQNVVNQLSMNKLVLDLLGKYLFFQQLYLQQQFQVLIDNSKSYRSIYNFDKSFFAPFVKSQESLTNQTVLFEYLDDVFYVAKTAVVRSLSTLNKSIACGMLNYIAHTFFSESVFKMQSDLIVRYFKKEYFTPTMISFSANSSVYNTFIISLLNNVEMLIVYLRKLKGDLLSEYQDLFANEKSNMVYSLIEEFEALNEKRFSGLLNEKMKLLAEYLKLTIKNDIDEFKEINFCLNEESLAGYEKTTPYSTDVKRKMSVYLLQWQHQFSKENYDLFTTFFCENFAKHLENILLSKKFFQMGAILLDKEIRSIVSFFQNQSTLNVKRCFSRLSLISEILTLESQKDMLEFHALGAGELSMEDIKRIIKLRADFKNI